MIFLVQAASKATTELKLELKEINFHSIIDLNDDSAFRTWCKSLQISLPLVLSWTITTLHLPAIVLYAILLVPLNIQTIWLILSPPTITNESEIKTPSKTTVDHS